LLVWLAAEGYLEGGPASTLAQSTAAYLELLADLAFGDVAAQCQEPFYFRNHRRTVNAPYDTCGLHYDPRLAQVDLHQVSKRCALFL